jgi:hypothetical protein
MKNCVVRTYCKSYSNPTGSLSEKLANGWTVKIGMPFVNSDGKTEMIEYILEKEDNEN